MLTELRVSDLGVIAEVSVVLGPGMTAVTGETGTGKTLMIEAIELLAGARADSDLVRSGASEARVEARFELNDDDRARLAEIDGIEAADLDHGELVLERVVPADGRSRAYCNGRMVTAGLLASVGRELVDLQGQHAHHALLAPPAQRAALDSFAGGAAAEALADYRAARARVRDLEEHLASLGGDTRERAREVDLLRYQVDEIDAAGIEDADEEARLVAEGRRLSQAEALQEAAADAQDVLEGAALDALGSAAAALESHEAFGGQLERVRVLQDEVGDVIREVRAEVDGLDDDPARLEEIGARRKSLSELRRKYGESLADVLAYRDEAAARLEDLSSREERAAEVDRQRQEALGDAVDAARRLSEIRRETARRLGPAIEEVLADLAMSGAHLEVTLEPRTLPEAPHADDLPEDGLDEVAFLLSANPGEPTRPLARVVSGGELARTMLAARVVLTHAPPTLVFDEVDAGIGGQAGIAVGRKLGMVAAHHQVVCVTHLAQVAAFAQTHIVVEKQEEEGRTRVSARVVEDADRVLELSRMLAGSGTARARDHAEELLVTAARERPS